MSENEIQVECSLCGRNLIPSPACSTCHGNAPVQERAYTLSEIRSGKAPQDDRYGRNPERPSTAPKHHDPLWVGAEIV